MRKVIKFPHWDGEQHKVSVASLTNINGGDYYLMVGDDISFSKKERVISLVKQDEEEFQKVPLKFPKDRVEMVKFLNTQKLTVSSVNLLGEEITKSTRPMELEEVKELFQPKQPRK